ncbi:DUF7848 domain-containing protein [Streptomyces sp. CLI2509]|uniref:DUF7848 domain-containing protein n=1 Tax=Streptomyces sp. CLI2509 TaxID=1984801 RepID=UPI003FA75D8D
MPRTYPPTGGRWRPVRPLARDAERLLYEDTAVPGFRVRSWCLMCGRYSPEGVNADSARMWCLEHNRTTGHASYRVAETQYLVVAREVGEPGRCRCRRGEPEG